MAPPDAPNVFHYLDARRFLGDYYAHKKASGRGFSFRAFSRRVGLGSPNYLKLVIDGDRNLTAEMAARFGAACGLADNGLAYFLDLVAFTQASHTDEKAARYERLLRFREHREVHKIDVAFSQYHSHWYIPAIREMAFRADFQNDPEWVAKRLLPAIKTSEAREALQLLIDLGLIAEADGRWKPADALVSTGPEVRGIHYVQYHRTMIGRALVALDDRPPADRDISSVTLCLDDDGISRLKDRLRAFRRELLQLSAEDENPRRVIQVNLQAFPLTRIDGDADAS
jgi:uncharacterized protein (TIGR02147 family)